MTDLWSGNSTDSKVGDLYPPVTRAVFDWEFLDEDILLDYVVRILRLTRNVVELDSPRALYLGEPDFLRASKPKLVRSDR